MRFILKLKNSLSSIFYLACWKLLTLQYRDTYRNIIGIVYDLFSYKGWKQSICSDRRAHWFNKHTQRKPMFLIFNAETGWYAGSDCWKDFIPIICRLVELDATSAPNLRGSCSGSLDQWSDESHYNFILGESHALQPTAAWPTLDVTKPVKVQMGIKELTEDSSAAQMSQWKKFLKWDAEKLLILNTKWCPALFLQDNLTTTKMITWQITPYTSTNSKKRTFQSLFSIHLAKIKIF